MASPRLSEPSRLGGLGLATSDLVNARSLLEGSRKAAELTATTPDDRPMAVQLFGSCDAALGNVCAQFVHCRYDGGTLNALVPVMTDFSKYARL